MADDSGKINYGFSNPDKGCKVPGNHMAVGYWGGDIYAQVFAEQQAARERALLTDQILAGSLRASLWQGATSGTRCACYKESNQQPDRKCGACHGVSGGFVPGYLKFGYATLWMTGFDPDVTLTHVRKADFKSAKMVLEDGEIWGTIESGDKPFSRTVLGSKWEYQSLFFLREEAMTDVVVEYSLDSGETWNDIATLPIANPSSGTIRFKATLRRDEPEALSPYFEIVRARYATISLSKPSGVGYRMGPWILVMRAPPQTRQRKYEYGDIPMEEGLTFWTAGLALFDPKIEYGSREELISGPDTFIEILDGVKVGNRYLSVQWQNSDPFGFIIVSQTFQIRIVDPVGPLGLVW